MARHTLNHSGVVFTITPQLHVLDSPSPIAIFVPSCHAYLCSGDCVEISGPPATFIGRIIRPSHGSSLLQLDSSIHPNYSSAAKTPHMGSALIQLYLTPDNCGGDAVIHPDEWPSVSLKDQRSCVGLTQATVTNAIVWVHVDQISRVVFCPHLSDCVNQTYGPMGGREHTYFVQSQVFFDSDAHYSFTSLGINDYSIIVYRFT
jgi:hypothetical protein